MNIIENVLIPDELTKELYFCCNVKKCKGVCCIDGDAGAPLEKHEIEIIQDCLEFVKPYMQKEAAEVVDDNNLFDYDDEGNLVTSLLENDDCIFVNFENDIAFCAIERAFLEKKIDFRKPISCYLYPIRVNKEGGFQKLTYHKWDICDTAVVNGKRKKIRMIDFLKKPLIEKFGKEWYNLFFSYINKKKT